MAFRSQFILNFLVQTQVPVAEQQEIKDRMKKAISAFHRQGGDTFPDRDLRKVLGNSELHTKFNAWREGTGLGR